MRKIKKILLFVLLPVAAAGFLQAVPASAQVTSNSKPINPYEMREFIASEKASPEEIEAKRKEYQEIFDKYNPAYETAKDDLEWALKVAFFNGDVKKYAASCLGEKKTFTCFKDTLIHGIPDIAEDVFKNLTSWDEFTTTVGTLLQHSLPAIQEFGDNKTAAIDSYISLIKNSYDSDPTLLALAEKAKEPAEQVTFALAGIGAYGDVSKDDEVYTYITSDGQTIYFIKEDNSYQTVGGVTRGCIPLPAKLSEYKSCIFCPMFLVIFNAAQTMATQAYAILAGPLSMVMLLGFAIFVAFLVLRYVSAFTKQDAPKFTNETLIQAFKVMFAFILLSNSSFVYNMIVGPVLSAGLEFGSSLLFENGSGYTEWCQSEQNLVKQVAKIEEDAKKDSSVTPIDKGVFPQYLYIKLDCFIRSVQAEISKPMAIGSTLMCVARNAGAADINIVVTKLENAIWDFGMFFQGLVIWGFTLLISLAFAFYLIDATVRLGIVGALMPFLIACWPFSVTSGYTKQGWVMFLNTFFTYVMMGLVISVNIQLILMSLTGGQNNPSELENAINGDNVIVLKDMLDIGFSGFLVLLACCLFGFKISGQANSLAAQFSGGGYDGKIGSGIGTLAASGLKGLAVGSKAGKIGGVAGAAMGAMGTVSRVTGLTAAYHKGRDRFTGGIGRAFGLGRFGGKAAAGGAAAAALNPGSSGAQNPQPQPQQNPDLRPDVLQNRNDLARTEGALSQAQQQQTANNSRIQALDQTIASSSDQNAIAAAQQQRTQLIQENARLSQQIQQLSSYKEQLQSKLSNVAGTKENKDRIAQMKTEMASSGLTQEQYEKQISPEAHAHKIEAYQRDIDQRQQDVDNTWNAMRGKQAELQQREAALQNLKNQAANDKDPANQAKYQQQIQTAEALVARAKQEINAMSASIGANQRSIQQTQSLLDTARQNSGKVQEKFDFYQNHVKGQSA